MTRFFQISLFLCFVVKIVTSFALSRSNGIVSQPVTSKTQLQEQETLNFRTGCSYETEIQDVDRETAVRFFLLPSTRNLFLSGGGKTKTQELDFSDEYKLMWEDCCQNYSESKDIDEKISHFVAGEAKAQFPGLSLVSTVLILAKLNEKTPSNLPEYNFFLVAEKRQLKGLKPVEWIFRQLTGTSKEMDEYFHPSQATSISKVSLVKKAEGFAISFNASLNVKISFPPRLLKILPMSKEKMEQQGSTSVEKAIIRDVKAAIEATNAAMQRIQNENKI